MTMRFFGVLVVVSMAVGCQADDEVDAASVPAAGSDPGSRAPAASTAPVRTGTIEIDGETWTLVPAIQCSIYPGPVVAVAGHSSTDEAIEITIDHDAERRFTEVSVANPTGAPDWRASGESLSFEIDGQTVSGKGSFTSTAGGSVRTAQGTFEVNCG